MSEKKQLQQPLVNYLKKKGIDFIHLSNSGFGGRHRAYSTTAFEDTPAIKEKIPCDKYFPDLLIAHGGHVWMVELGIHGSHKERKAKQAERMAYWRDCGGVIINTITSEDSLKSFIKQLEEAEK